MFVAANDRYTVHALSADTGRPIWSRPVGARVDSPPTVYGNAILFGCADGQVYCLRARDGELAWRRRISPENRFAVAFDRVESVWPVHGSVLIHDGAVYAVAGRSSYLDGGLRLCRLDPTTGRELGSETIYSRDPETGAQAEDNIRGMDMEGALPDVLSTDGKFIFMRHARHAPDTLKRIDEFHSLFEPDASFHKRHPAGHPLFQNPDRGLNIFSPTGFLDDSWWHRTYWIYGTFYPSCCPYYRAGTAIPAGRILAFDESSVYGFGRKRQYWGWWTPLEYHLFSTNKLSKPGKLSPGRRGVRKSWQGHLFLGDYGTRVEYDWSEDVPLHVRAMVLAGRTLFVAGPPDVKDETTLSLAALQYSDALSHETMDESLAAWRGAKGARLRAISAADGRTLREYPLDGNPVFDGMAAAGDRLILTTTGGKVVCMKASTWVPVTAETAKGMARQREARRQQQVEEQAVRAFSEGFERAGDIDWNHVRGSFQYTGEMAHSGRRSLKTILDDGGISAHHADLLVRAGRYVLSGWLLIKAGEPTAPWAAPAVCETDWRPIAEAKVTEAGAWRRFEIPFELKATRLVRINLNPRLHQSGLAGAVIYWDDIELRPAE